MKGKLDSSSQPAQDISSRFGMITPTTTTTTTTTTTNLRTFSLINDQNIDSEFFFYHFDDI